MADPITLSIVAIYVADKIVGKLISDKGTSALQKFFFPTKSYKNRLAKIIDETIKQFDSRYPKHNSKGRFRFYGSEIILTELSKHILFRTDYDTKIINSKIKENPNIIVPSENELAEFFELFVEKINNDSNLHELHVNETYKNKIFEISVQVHSSLQLLSEIRKKLMDDNLNFAKSLFTSNAPLDTLIKKTTPLDLEILDALRIRNEDSSKLERHFQIYYKGIDTENQTFINSSLKIINDKTIEIKPDKPEMTIEVSPGKQVLYQIDKFELTVQKPKLLWECNCKIEFPKKYNRKPCPIHSKISNQNIKEEFSSCFSKGLVNIEVSGLNIFWNNQKNLWPPSMDSIYLIEDLIQNGYDKKFFNRIIDVGSGTGYLGIWLSKHNKYVKESYFTDWMLLPLIFTYFNTELNNLDNVNCVFKLGINTDWIKNDKSIGKFDLAICNPPYLPLLSGKESFMQEMTVAGTDLLKSFILNWKDIAEEAIISFSDIALPEALNACIESDSRLIPIGKKRNVPFRVNAAYTEKNYIPNLLKQKRIQFRRNSFFPYWHKVQSYRIEENSAANN